MVREVANERRRRRERGNIHDERKVLGTFVYAVPHETSDERGNIPCELFHPCINDWTIGRWWMGTYRDEDEETKNGRDEFVASAESKSKRCRLVEARGRRTKSNNGTS